MGLNMCTFKIWRIAIGTRSWSPLSDGILHQPASLGPSGLQGRAARPLGVAGGWPLEAAAHIASSSEILRLLHVG